MERENGNSETILEDDFNTIVEHMVWGYRKLKESTFDPSSGHDTYWIRTTNISEEDVLRKSLLFIGA